MSMNTVTSKEYHKNKDPICIVNVLDSNTMKLIEESTPIQEQGFECYDKATFDLVLNNKCKEATLAIQYVNTALSNIVLKGGFKNKHIHMDYLCVTVKFPKATPESNVWVRYGGEQTNWFELEPALYVATDEEKVFSVYTNSAVYLRLCKKSGESENAGPVIHIGLNLHPLSFQRYADSEETINARENKMKSKKPTKK